MSQSLSSSSSLLILIEPAQTDLETNLRKQLKLIYGFASVAVVATLIQFIQYLYLQDHYFKHNGPYGCLAKVALATSLSCLGPVSILFSNENSCGGKDLPLIRFFSFSSVVLRLALAIMIVNDVSQW